MPARIKWFRTGSVVGFANALCLGGAIAQPIDLVGLPPGCVTDQSVKVCVISAALTNAPWQGEWESRFATKVSVTMRVTNTTEFPIDVAVLDPGYQGWAFTPQNAESITNIRDESVSGLQVCNQSGRCQFSTLASGMSAMAQLTYRGEFSTDALPLVQAATNASFSASLVVSQRGEPSLMSLALDGFSFGNILKKHSYGAYTK